MWKLFDFNSDGKTSLFEKVVGIELLESIIHDENATIDESKSNDDETDEEDVAYDLGHGRHLGRFFRFDQRSRSV